MIKITSRNYENVAQEFKQNDKFTFFAFSRSFAVKFPVPGPISMTTSELLMAALSTILCTTIGF